MLNVIHVDDALPLVDRIHKAIIAHTIPTVIAQSSFQPLDVRSHERLGLQGIQSCLERRLD
jgi:hypothetical protein